MNKPEKLEYLSLASLSSFGDSIQYDPLGPYSQNFIFVVTYKWD
jgi:hypothetical protein